MFNSEQEYRAMRDFSAEKNILLYDDTRQKVLVVSDEGYEHVRAWRKQQTWIILLLLINKLSSTFLLAEI